MRLLSHLLITSFALLLAAYVIPGITIDGIYSAVIAALILGLLNILVKPVLFILTLPVTIITLGLFSFVINAALFWFAASFIDGFAVDGFFAALLGSLFVSIINSIGSKFIS